MTRAQLPALGYLYVALALPALLLGVGHGGAVSALFTLAAFAYFWFLASLRARVVRFDPDGFFASVVVMGGAVFIALQAVALFSADTRFAAPSSAAASVVIIGSSLAAWRARKIPKWFGQAGVAGGVAVLAVGFVEGAADWTFGGDTVFHVYEAEEDDKRQREDGQDEGVIPRNLIAAAVKAEEEENEGHDQQGSAQEVNSFQRGFVVFSDWDLDEEGNQEAGYAD